MRSVIIFAILLTASIAGATSYTPSQMLEAQGEATIEMESLSLQGLSGPGGPLAIPKTWKLISVSNGDKANDFCWWFQADDGSVYAIQGFYSRNRIALHDQVFKIPAK
jgi:hypothetical protein